MTDATDNYEQQQDPLNNYQQYAPQEEIITVPQQQESQTDKFLIVIKYVNMAAGAFVSLIGMYFLFTLKLWGFSNILMSIYSMFLPIFYIFFGVLLILGEFFKDTVNLYAKFIRSYLGRGIFNIFLATQCNIGWWGLGITFADILMMLGAIYVFLFFIRDRINEDVEQKLLE